MEQGEFIAIGALIVVLILVYMIMKRRTDKIRSKRDNHTRFRRKR